MAENACFPSLLMDLRSYNTCNQGNKYMEICRTILCINITNNSMKEKEGKKFYQFKSQISRLFQFFTAFHVATINPILLKIDIRVRITMTHV